MVDVVPRSQAATAGAGSLVGARPRAYGALRRFLASLNLWFWAIVGIPTLVAGVYFFAIAADLYSSEAVFIIRGPAKQPAAVGGIAGLLGGMAMGGGSEETYAVHEYLMSRDVVRRLEQEDHLRAVLARPEGDVITRFPGMWFWRGDFEALFKSYQHFVTVDTQADTGVSTLRVKAYRPEDAQMIARALLADSEQLVNQLNERARQDALKTFQQEVALDQQHLAQIQEQLTAYRLKEKMLDPKSASSAPLELLGQLNAQAANTRGQLAEVIKNSPNSPQIPLLKTRIASLDKLIAEERSKITGDDNSVATTLTEYERLDLQRTLGEKLLTSAVASLETARLEAQRQQLYLETITQPNLADYPIYPKRAASFAMVVASCLLAYGIIWLLAAGVREHAAA